MRHADARALEWVEPPAHHREGHIAFKRLFDGTPGTPENYTFALVRILGGYHTPRHRHNYDQVRFCLTGSIDYGQGRAVKAGQVGYFPEGVPYGPQDITEQDAIVLQCGGASGQGFLTGAQLREGRARLEGKGRFEGGVFLRDEGAEGRRKQDGYEAVWEEVTGRRLDYPAARFAEPVVMDPAAFAWREAGPGLAQKHLGTFGERALAIEMWRIAPGAALELPGAPARRLAYAVAGAAAGEAWEAGPGEAARLAPAGGAELLVLSLPPVSAAAH
jgi:quercetin dioxygenase-like cupin family protein